MSITSGFTRTCCGQEHGGLPFAYAMAAPVYWSDALAANPGNVLGDEHYVIDDEHFFEDPARVDEPPYFGWLSTVLPGYESHDAQPQDQPAHAEDRHPAVGRA